jgi:hypothetical protein
MMKKRLENSFVQMDGQKQGENSHIISQVYLFCSLSYI